MHEEKVYCSMYSRNAELYHHGIKGQKWGVQNGPPYPLGSDISTGKRLKKESPKDGDIFFALWAAAASAEVAGFIGAVVKNAIDVKRENKAKANLGVQGKQAKEIYDSLKNKKEIPEKYKKNGDPLIISEKELKSINPDYSKGAKGRIKGATNNCTRCASSFLLHKKGYLVEAAKRYEGDSTEKMMKACFNSTPTRMNSRGKFKELLESKPEGSYGALAFTYENSNSGHVLNWAKENGQIVIYDSQPGKKMTYSKFISKYPVGFSNSRGGIEVYDVTSSKINWKKVYENEITV